MSIFNIVMALCIRQNLKIWVDTWLAGRGSIRRLQRPVHDTLALIWHTIISEFSDIADAQQATVVVLRLGLAAILGAAIGYERERRGKEAGLRTHMLVTLGAALFILVPASSGMDSADASRVMQGVVSGIGFLGAGAILKQARGEEVKGLTTAASIWVAAAIGIAVGYGREATAVACTLIALFVLSVVGRPEQ